MNSLFSPLYKREDFIPVVHAYYDRADMERTTLEETDHSHTLCEIMYVAEGSLSLTVENQRVRLGRQQCIWIDASVYHHDLRFDVAGGPCSVMNIEFQYELLDRRCPSTRALYRHSEAFRALLDHPAPFLTLTDDDATLFTLLKQIILLADSTHVQAERMCSFLCAHVMLLVARRRAAPQGGECPTVCNSYVASALCYIRDNYTEPLTAQQIAGYLHIQPTYLHRLFREQTGMTVGAHIQRLRIERAKELLQETDDNLLQIANAVGLNSPQYFVQLFRRLCGISPTEYRRQLAASEKPPRA